MSQDPHAILSNVFGYNSFRGDQELIIKSVLNNDDALVLMPTGGGKSLCYQVPVLCKSGIGIIISPLIALMKDQVDALRLNGVEAKYLNSSQSSDEQQEVLSLAKAGKLKFLYVSPERLMANDGWLVDYLKQCEVNLIAVDEAHCISQWGHDFRPEYRKLRRLKLKFPEVPFIALTATADKKTADDIVRNLNLEEPKRFVSSFNRANIFYTVLPKKDSRQKLYDFLKDKKGQSGIVYTLSRKSAEELAQRLIDMGVMAWPYHAGMSSERRAQTQDRFINDQIDIVVATIAFGMGIDKSNVRFVVHMDLPKNIEGYYQETGRAGRDGLNSEALMFFSRGDAMILRQMIEGVDEKYESILLGKLNKMVAFGETRQCRRKTLLAYFGEEFPEDNCQSCDNCLRQVDFFDGTVIAQKALSAVMRLKQNFGINYVIDFLRGSKSQKIKEEHTWLKTYGVGKDLSKNEWSNYIRNLIDQNYLKLADGKYPVLKIGVKGLAVLYDDAKVQLEQIPKDALSKKIDLSIKHEDLFEMLKRFRLKLAGQERVAPYQIFSDKTLIELVNYLPLQSDDLLKISGFGHIKRNRYGDGFLKLIRNYVKQNNLESNMGDILMRKISKSTKDSNISSSTQIESFNLFKEGFKIDEIAERRSLSKMTIENHLIHFIAINKLDLSALVDASKIDSIQEALNKTKGLGLAAAKNILGSDYSYAEIKAVLSSKS